GGTGQRGFGGALFGDRAPPRCPPPTPPPPLPGPLALGLCVLRVPRPIRPPVGAVLPRPRTLRTRLIVPVVGIILPLGPLPASPPHTPALFLPAILLIGNLWAWPKRLAAPGTSPLLHRRAPRPDT